MCDRARNSYYTVLANYFKWGFAFFCEKLKNFDYYLKKIPLYLQSDENFVSHFRIWYDFLVGKENETNNGLIGSGDTLLDLFNIYDENSY